MRPDNSSLPALPPSPSPSQVKKIRKELLAFGVGAAAGAAAAAPAPAAAPVEAAKAEAAPPAAVSGDYSYPPAPAGYPSGAAPSAPPAPGAVGAASADELAAKASAAQGHAATYGQATLLLRRAEENLRSASNALKVNQVSGATEMMQDVRIGARGGGLFGRHRGMGRQADRRSDFGHNMVEVATARRASTQVQEVRAASPAIEPLRKGYKSETHQSTTQPLNLHTQAGRAISEARNVLPTLPNINPAHVQSAMSGTLLNAFLMPGLVGDVMQMSKVKRAQANLQEMLQETQAALAWCAKNQQAAQASAAALGAQAAAAR